MRTSRQIALPIKYLQDCATSVSDQTKRCSNIISAAQKHHSLMCGFRFQGKMEGCACLHNNGSKGKQPLVFVLAIFCSLSVLLGCQRTGRSSGPQPVLEVRFEGDSHYIQIDQGSVQSDKSRNSSAASSFAACNYSKGRWVLTNDSTYYSGKSCKRWLPKMWKCRLTNRPDFGYEQYHWQPEGCDLPKFNSIQFLSRMKNKTIAFVGDSLGRQQFQSLMCMITHGDKEMIVEDVGSEFGLLKKPGAMRPDGWAYKIVSTSTTVLFYRSVTLCNIVPYNIDDSATAYAVHLDKPVLFLQTYIDKFDVLVINTGHHWKKEKLEANRWKLHVNGSLISDATSQGLVNALRITVDNVVRWLNDKTNDIHRRQIFLRTISPRHFRNGDWNSGGTCDSLKPLDNSNTEPLEDYVIQNALVVQSSIVHTQIKLFNITYLSQFREDAHISKYSRNQTDCLHWCLPGVPDVWNEILASHLLG